MNRRSHSEVSRAASSPRSSSRSGSRRAAARAATERKKHIADNCATLCTASKRGRMRVAIVVRELVQQSVERPSRLPVALRHAHRVRMKDQYRRRRPPFTGDRSTSSPIDAYNGGSLDVLDHLIFRPADVDRTRSPLRRSLDAPTRVLGAFNPGLARLPNGNLLLMVRIAEALTEPIVDDAVRSIRWTPDGYVLDRHRSSEVDTTDPRQFARRGGPHRLLGLTSISWLLPVELTPDGGAIVAVHYDQVVEPAASYQQYGVEDARISHIDGRWYMTACSVSAERLHDAYTSRRRPPLRARGDRPRPPEQGHGALRGEGRWQVRRAHAPARRGVLRLPGREPVHQVLFVLVHGQQRRRRGRSAGIVRRLDYLPWLGVDALWLSPFYPSPMADFGYDSVRYWDVDPLFGTLADFDALVGETHRRSARSSSILFPTTRPPRTLVRRRASSRRAIRSATGTSGDAAPRTAGHRTTGSAPPTFCGSPGNWTRVPSITTTRS